MVLPSISWSIFAPAASQIVGNRSIVSATRSDLEPGLILPDAAFVHILLSCAEWAVVCADAELAAVVGGEDNKRIAAQAGLLQCSEDLADAVV